MPGAAGTNFLERDGVMVRLMGSSSLSEVADSLAARSDLRFVSRCVAANSDLRSLAASLDSRLLAADLDLRLLAADSGSMVWYVELSHSL